MDRLKLITHKGGECMQLNPEEGFDSYYTGAEEDAIDLGQ